jgi:hypothetical protein
LQQRPFNALGRITAALAIATLGVGLGGCAPRAAPCDVDHELAELRRHDRALRDEIAALRQELDRLTDALAPETDRNAGPAGPERPAPLRKPGEEPALAALLETYRTAVEAEDWTRLRYDVYGGRLPAEDRRYLELWFERTDDLQVELEPRAIETEDGRARAIVRQTMIYRLSRTGERRWVVIDLRMVFQRRDGRWKLVHADPRR